jgi:hypothetical protein
MIKNIITISFLLILFIQTGCRKHQEIPPPEIPVLSDKKAFLKFGFKKENNPALLADIHAEIGKDTIYAKLISGISADQLIPYFTFEGQKVSIDTDTLKQQSDVHPQNFNKNLVYHITAEDGSRKSYTVVLETDIPVMHINTNGISINSKEEYIDAHMKLDGNLPAEFLYDGKMRIRGRGNFTWGLPKNHIKLN